MIQKHKINKYKCPEQKWMTIEILKKKRLMDIARKKFIKRRSVKNENNYKTLKKDYHNDIKTAKNTYYGLELSKAQKNSKKIWQIINTLVLNKSKSEPKNMNKI